MSIKYALKYEWHVFFDKEYTIDDIDNKDNQGLCDKFIFISILNLNDGYSQQITSMDGIEKKSLNHNDLFKAWLVMGLTLYDENECIGWKHEILKMVADNSRRLFKK